MEVRVEASKVKTYTLLAGILLLSVILLLAIAATIKSGSTGNASFMLLVLVFFSCVYFTVAGIKKILDRTPGLLLTSEGVQYSISSLGKAVGLVKWSDIKELRGLGRLGRDGKLEINTEQSYVTVVVSNPHYYIGRMKQGLTRTLAEKQACKNNSGVLLFIASHELSCNLAELKEYIFKSYELYRQQQENLA